MCRAAAPTPRIGLNLAALTGDPLANLPRVAQAGYREIELPLSLRTTRVEILSKALTDAGLRAITAQWDIWTDPETLVTMDTVTELGIPYLIQPFPALMTDKGLNAGTGTPAEIRELAAKMTLNDWRWNVECFNHEGGILQKGGLQFTYKTHDFEFRKLNGVQPFQYLMENTEFTRVKVQLDCAAAHAAGIDPVALMQRYSDRVVMLHLAVSARDEWPRWLAAAREIGVTYAFVTGTDLIAPPRASA